MYIALVEDNSRSIGGGELGGKNDETIRTLIASVAPSAIRKLLGNS